MNKKNTKALKNKKSECKELDIFFNYQDEIFNLYDQFKTGLTNLRDKLVNEIETNKDIREHHEMFKILFDGINQYLDSLVTKNDETTAIFLMDIINFTERERDVLDLVSQGMNIKEICKILDYGDSTIRKIINRIVEKIVCESNKKSNKELLECIKVLVPKDFDNEKTNYTLKDLRKILNINFYSLDEEKMLLYEKKMQNVSNYTLVKFANDWSIKQENKKRKQIDKLLKSKSK